MKKYLTVHIYGKCGAPCPGTTEEDCLEYLAGFYTFLLVFETHVCQNYISPQLLRVLHLTKNSIIPVVFGGINYNELFSNTSVDPPSYMYTRNKTIRYSKYSDQSTSTGDGTVRQVGSNLQSPSLFMIDALGQSPRALAHYLKHLVKESSKKDVRRVHLGDYLRWKAIYNLYLTEWPCLLCEKLRRKKIYKEKYLKIESSRNEYQPELVSSELCTSWPTLDFSGGYQ